MNSDLHRILSGQPPDSVINEGLIKVGDHVRYTAKFLRSAGIYTGDIPQMCGTVTRMKSLGKGTKLAVVKMHGNVDPKDSVKKINVYNLEKGRNPMCKVKP